MAFTESEIKKLTELSNEMAKLIEDADNTSNEASVIWGQAGHLFARGLSRHAAMEAKKTTRVTETDKFKAARQARMEKKGKKGGTTTTSTPNGATGAGRSQRSA